MCSRPTVNFSLISSAVVVGTLDPWTLLVTDITLYIDIASVMPLYLEES